MYGGRIQLDWSLHELTVGVLSFNHMHIWPLLDTALNQPTTLDYESNPIVDIPKTGLEGNAPDSPRVE